ncbi:MAG: RNA chaperone Hfq [Nitrospirae bacterium]|nr:RNA chaperone Hfq [Nitrospirota bacterium]MBI3394006.1 RNA chaperone Hfq [Nitrospirota bacterium]
MDQDQVNPAFDRYVAARTPLTVTLRNGTRLSGRLKKYDAYLLLVSQPPGERTVLIYRHAVSSILARGKSPSAPQSQPRVSAAPVRTPTARSAPRHERPPAARPSRPAPAPPTARKEAPPVPAAAANEPVENQILKWMEKHRVEPSP